MNWTGVPYETQDS